MYIPASTPVKAGQPIRLNLGKVSRPELTDLEGKDIEATIVRVDRQAVLSMGHLAVGARFSQQAP